MKTSATATMVASCLISSLDLSSGSTFSVRSDRKHRRFVTSAAAVSPAQPRADGTTDRHRRRRRARDDFAPPLSFASPLPATTTKEDAGSSSAGGGSSLSRRRRIVSGSVSTTPLYSSPSHSSSSALRSTRGTIPTSTNANASPGAAPPAFGSGVVVHCPPLGGPLVRIRSGPDDDGFLSSVGVPTYAAVPTTEPAVSLAADAALSAVEGGGDNRRLVAPRRLGLEGATLLPGSFLLRNAVPVEWCEQIINACEGGRKENGEGAADLFGTYDAGKNRHGAMQIVVPRTVADDLLAIIGPHVDAAAVEEAARQLLDNDAVSAGGGGREEGEEDIRYSVAGINRRLRVYRYAAQGVETFAPHIDAGFCPSGLSDEATDGVSLRWDASDNYSETNEVVSRLTVLIYLNEDFVGGHTKFYASAAEKERQRRALGGKFVEEDQLIASVRPTTGSILVLPQAVSERAVEIAREFWPLHEGSSIAEGSPRPKYVIRTDVLFETSRVGQCLKKTDDNIVDEEDLRLFQHDGRVRRALLPTSPAFDAIFRSRLEPLYNPHMGVENAGPVLYSLIRFAKLRSIVEIGAGYTTPWLLRALADNDEEMGRVADAEEKGELRLLDYPFGVPEEIAGYFDDRSSDGRIGVCSNGGRPSSLLCIDDCLHQRQTATGAVGVAKSLGLSEYLQFRKCDAFDLELEEESVDLLWCDFGVGARMKEFVSSDGDRDDAGEGERQRRKGIGAWRAIRPGGFLVCHSTLTNAGTRRWIEGVRDGRSEEETGIPPGEVSELSLLEPHKRFQNSLSILQRRVGNKGGRYEEPIYSEYA